MSHFEVGQKLLALEGYTSDSPSQSDLAEWSRPERSFKTKQKEKARKESNIGRPSTGGQPHRAIATNWFEPHLWTIITSEARFVPSMSPKELENRLRANHPRLFGNIRAQVLGRMMARDKNGKKVWSMQTLERAERHNGHNGHSTRHGILASKCCGS